MVSIIKNQLLKHLSRYTKNLSPDKINISTFKGEGELSHLELDEKVLTDLLELPCWLELTNAWCNRVTFKVPWTKLKSVPITLNLDEVLINVRTCEDLRELTTTLTSPLTPGAGTKYGFIQKAIDGITININNVVITFQSVAFSATLQLSRIHVESVSPAFKPADLRITRLKDPTRGELLIFKELTWQTMRIEAKSTVDAKLTPLRLLTNQARCRITIKKRLSDCYVMGCRLLLILDDLLWVITDSQLKAAIVFITSLSGLVQRATELIRRQKAERKLRSSPEYSSQAQPQKQHLNGADSLTKIFARYDVHETSYHFFSQRIDLHLCDDPSENRSISQSLTDGGALQISVCNFQADFYPYHLAVDDRKHWAKYDTSSSPHTQFFHNQLQLFKLQVNDMIQSQVPPHQENAEMSKLKTYVNRELSKLMTSCIVLRVLNFTVYKVTTVKNQRLKEFVSSDRDRYSLPHETNVIHAEFVYYYYPGDREICVPAPKLYAHLNPLHVNFDKDSLLWLNAFALNLLKSFLSEQSVPLPPDVKYIDVRVEAIMPRVIFEDEHKPGVKIASEYPKALHVNISKLILTNVRSTESSISDLAKCVNEINLASLFETSEFPNRDSDGSTLIPAKFLHHMLHQDDVRDKPQFEFDENSKIYHLVQQLKREMLWLESRDVWHVQLDPLWLDFTLHNAPGKSNKPVPFLDSVPLQAWVYVDVDRDCICAIAHVDHLISLQVNHWQFLFLLALQEELSDLAMYLNIDTNRVIAAKPEDNLLIQAKLSQIEVNLLMPRVDQSQDEVSAGGDMESVIPDSSSMIEDFVASSTLTSLHLRGKMPTIGSDMCGFSSTLNQNVVMEEEFIPSPVSETYTSPTSAKSPDIKLNEKVVASTIKDINVGLSSMKKGFSSLMTSIDSAIKGSVDDASDTMSIRSDMSSDSDKYVCVNLNNDESLDAMFRLPNDPMQSSALLTNGALVEMASEVVCDEDSISISEQQSIASSVKRRELTVATLKLSFIEFCMQSSSVSSAIKLQVFNVLLDECGHMTYEEFQHKFSSRTRAWTENMLHAVKNDATRRIRLRLDHKFELDNVADIDLNEPQRAFSNKCQILVSDINLSVTSSTIKGIVDLIDEDETSKDVLPATIDVENVNVELIENSKAPGNYGSTAARPIKIQINKFHATRNADGSIFVEQNTDNPTSTSQSKHDSFIAKLRDDLHRQQALSEQLKHDNYMLRKQNEEMTQLRLSLMNAEELIGKLLNDKESLLNRLTQMQQQRDNGTLKHQQSLPR